MDTETRSDAPAATQEWTDAYDNGPMYGPFCSLRCMDGYDWAITGGHIDGRYTADLIARNRCPYCGKKL